MLNRKQLRERYSYDRRTGEVRNKINHHKAVIGELAGTIAKGRVRLRVDGVARRGADVVWTIARGEIPKGMVASYHDWKLTGYASLKLSNLYLCSYEEHCLNVKHGCKITAEETGKLRKKMQRHINPDADKQEPLRKPVFVLGRPPQ